MPLWDEFLLMENIVCPCGGGLYQDCCLPLHQNAENIVTAEQLMRSRYSAYVLKMVDYLVATTHSDKQEKSLKYDIEAWIDQPQWQNLEIVSTRFGGVEDKLGWVEFKAHFILNGEKQVLHEKSRFKRDYGQWRYYDGKIFA